MIASSHYHELIKPMSSTPQSAPPRRTTVLIRNTNETKINVSLSLDGGPLPDASSSSSSTEGSTPTVDTAHASQSSSTQTITINTGIGFLDHMFHALAKHSGWSLSITCNGDLHSAIPHPPSPILILLLHPHHLTKIIYTPSR
jgi:imidazoleglycerol phosphate dehydratase HisB